jgi:L-asparaginase/Glu-tRNA(Gln) amidotransferase subunit D
MLENLTKPVVFTGGRICMEEPNNDLIINLMESCFIAGAMEIPEVCIYCDCKLFRANRAVLYQPNCVNAFISPNSRLLGVKSAKINIKWRLTRKKPKVNLLENIKINREFNSNVNHCYYIPGLCESEIDSIFDDPHCSTMLVEFFGAGNTPDVDSYLVKKMKEAIDRKCLVFFTSQCHKGTVSS